MRSDVGLLIAGKAGSMDRDQIYDSRKPKLTLDPAPTPPHFDLLQDFKGGTKFTLPDAQVSQEEILFQIKHGLPFTPMFAVYFTQTKTPPDRRALLSQYSINMSLMLYNAIALGEEWVYADADETYFYIKHKAERFGYGDGSSYTFLGSDFEFRIRYMIFNRPTYLLPGGKMPQ